MRVFDPDFLVCVDCMQAIANDDFTGLDYHYSEPEASQRMKEIQHGIANVPGHISPGDEEKDREFSNLPCECCGEQLAGYRHHCVILIQE